ncbi:hypothetical protein HDU97_004158 [Phlyctochytrium planicorne]|nr:hypothetical protein HDU97_004158 [Phlyctochytrium planicorne]
MGLTSWTTSAPLPLQPFHPPNGKFAVPSNIQSIRITVTGITLGTIRITSSDSLEVEPSLAIHFETTYKAIPTLQHSNQSGTYEIAIKSPKMTLNLGEKMVSVFEFTIPRKSLAWLNALMVDADMMNVAIKLEDDVIAKILQINSKTGSISLSGVTAHNSLHVATKTGSINIGKVSCADAEISSSTGSINFEDSTITNSIEIHTDTGSLSTDNLKGGFRSMIQKTNTGSMYATKIQLNKQMGTEVDLKSITGSMCLDLYSRWPRITVFSFQIDFFGDFAVKTSVGGLNIEGSGVKFQTDKIATKVGERINKNADTEKGGEKQIGQSHLYIKLNIGSAAVTFR